MTRRHTVIIVAVCALGIGFAIRTHRAQTSN